MILGCIIVIGRLSLLHSPSVDTWNRWALITLQSYYMELWKHTGTGVDALFASAIAVDGALRDSGPPGEGSAT